MPDPNQDHLPLDRFFDGFRWQKTRVMLVAGVHLPQHDRTKTPVNAFFRRGIHVSLKGTGSLGLFQYLCILLLSWIQI